jgi:hypothetical protein
MPDRCREGPDADRPGHLPGQRGEFTLGGGEGLGEALGVRGEQSPGRGEAGSPPPAQPRPVEQYHAGVGFQAGNVLGYRRWGQVQHGGRRENPARVGHGTEYGQSPRIDLHSEMLHTTCIDCRYH